MTAKLFVELDATSSGVQFAAALAKDAVTAKLVNLTGGVYKKDLYGEVAKYAQKLFEQDAAAGNETAQAVLALSAKGLTGKAHFKLSRGDVKKSVLATTYGGTENTSKDNVKEKLEGTPAEPYADYVAKKVWEAVTEKLSAVLKVNQWFHAAVEVLATSGKTKFYFTTAAGKKYFFHLNPKTKTKYKKVKVFGNVHEVKYTTVNEDKLNLNKASNQACSQFVQGFDAALLHTVLATLHHKGVVCEANHDSFLVAAENEKVLLETAKQAFYDLFKDDVCWVSKVKAEFEEQSGVTLPEFVPTNTFKVKEVLESNYLLAA